MEFRVLSEFEIDLLSGLKIMNFLMKYIKKV